MLKLIRYTITTIIFITGLALSGVIQFTEKGKESLKLIQGELKTAVLNQLKEQTHRD